MAHINLLHYCTCSSSFALRAAGALTAYRARTLLSTILCTSVPSQIINLPQLPSLRRHYNCSNSLLDPSADTHIQLGQLRSPQLVALEYAELNLSYNFPEEVGQVRVRQHVNPLSSSFSKPVQVPDWKEVFRDPKLPLNVDIGCGSGRFLMWLAKNSDTGNFLGLEIRNKLVKRADFWVEELGLGNIYFMFANASVSFEQLVSTYPGPLMLVTILCPDPHFKKRHQKRRVVQKPLVDLIVSHLMPAGKVFMQSDVFEVALEMRSQFDMCTSLRHIDAIDENMHCDDDGWLLRNPMGIRTEREIHAEFEGARMYRRVYQRLP